MPNQVCFPGGDGSGAMTFLDNSRPDFFYALIAGRANIEGSAGEMLHQSCANGEETRMEKGNLLTGYSLSCIVKKVKTELEN